MVDSLYTDRHNIFADSGSYGVFTSWVKFWGCPPTVASPHHCPRDGWTSRSGEALCCNVALVSPLRADGRPHPGAARNDGHDLHIARRHTETRCPELT